MEKGPYRGPNPSRPELRCPIVITMARSSKDLPGTFEGETVTRRRFMNGVANATGAVAAAAITLPALGFAIGPVFDRAPATWQKIGPLSRFNGSDYVPVVFTV